MNTSIDITALFIIDVQKGFINEFTCHIPEKVEKMQYNYKHVIATKFANYPESPYIRFLNWNDMMDDQKTELAFTLAEHTKVFTKHTYTCLTDEIKDFIKQNNINTVHICGIDTDACVLACAFALFDNNIKPVILKDCCASSGGIAYHERAIEILKRNIGEVV